MKLKLDKCLALDVFKDATLLADTGNKEIYVKSVGVLESFEEEYINKYMAHKGELVFTGLFGAKDDIGKQLSCVRQLAASEAAGLVMFYVGSVSKEVSKEVIKEAEKLGLPLIKMKDGTNPTQGEVTNAVVFGMMREEDPGNRLISNTVSHLLNFEKHASFQEALKEAAIKNDFQVVLLSSDFNPILTIETRYRTTIQDAINLGRTRETDVERSPLYTLLDVNGVLTYWGPIKIDNEKYFMFIVDNEDTYTAGEITKLAEIIELAMGMWKYTPERDAKAELIKTLIRGNKSLAYTLKDEAGIKPQDIISVFFARGIDTVLSPEAIVVFEKESSLSLLRVNEGEETFGMIVARGQDRDEDQAVSKMNAIKLYNNLKEDKNVRIFHVTGVDGIEGAGDAFRLINESWSFVQTVFPYKRVFTKYELTLVNNCINIQLQGGYVKKNYMELLEAFDDKNNHKERQLLETLETFVLDAGMNSGKTSDFLGIHTNTVQYRLKKINDILGVEITGNRVVPGLTIALALKRLERVIA